MTLEIQISPEAEARLREKAAAAGEDIASYAARVFHEAIIAPSVDERLAPFRKQVEESGMSDEQLDQFYEGLRDKVWAEQQARRTKSA